MRISKNFRSIIGIGLFAWLTVACIEHTAKAADNYNVLDVPASSAPSGAAGGDLSGTYPNPTVSNITNGTFTGTLTGPRFALTGNGAASISPFTLSGTPFAGTGTTSTPLFYLNNGAAPTNQTVTGTYFGINSASGSTSDYVGFRSNGGNLVFQINSAGAIISNGGIIVSSFTGQMTAAGVEISNNLAYQFSSTAFANGTPDTFITRAGAGIIAIGAASGAGNVTGKLALAGITTVILTVATLPTCNTAAKGLRESVSDATAPVFLTTLVGSGTVFSTAVCNGTAWVAG